MGFVLDPPHPIAPGTDAADPVGRRVAKLDQPLRGPAMHQQRLVRKAMHERKRFEPRGCSLSCCHITRSVIRQHPGEALWLYRQVRYCRLQQNFFDARSAHDAEQSSSSTSRAPSRSAVCIASVISETGVARSTS